MPNERGTVYGQLRKQRRINHCKRKRPSQSLNSNTFQRTHCTTHNENCLKLGQCTKHRSGQNECSALKLVNQLQKATGKASTRKMKGKAMTVLIRAMRGQWDYKETGKMQFTPLNNGVLRSICSLNEYRKNHQHIFFQL